jgi:hypothetical protein
MLWQGGWTETQGRRGVTSVSRRRDKSKRDNRRVGWNVASRNGLECGCGALKCGALKCGALKCGPLRRTRRFGVGAVLGVGLLVPVLFAPMLLAQGCTTQAGMATELRSALADKALELATAVEGNDASKVQSDTIAEFATNFGPTADLVHTTSSRVVGDRLRVTQIYELNASNRKAGDTSEAEFTCPLIGTVSETDFAIPGLPPGMYAFAMVEANGAKPWLLAFLLEQEGGQWKLAGFYPRARTAAGQDGLWYWRAARQDAKEKKLWLAWLFYGEAEDLLRPANFVSSTNLDLLETERRTAVPPELSDGIGLRTPLVVRDAAGATGAGATAAGAVRPTAGSDFRFIGISTEGSEDGKGLNLMLHLELEAGTDPVAPDPATATARNTAAAAALLDAHRELRQEFENVWVIAESPGHGNFATEAKVANLP